jgi:hypothetical protein
MSTAPEAPCSSLALRLLTLRAPCAPSSTSCHVCSPCSTAGRERLCVTCLDPYRSAHAQRRWREIVHGAEVAVAAEPLRSYALRLRASPCLHYIMLHDSPMFLSPFTYLNPERYSPPTLTKIILRSYLVVVDDQISVRQVCAAAETTTR